MKYEIIDGAHAFSPDDLFEAKLVMTIIRWKLEGWVPYFVDRSDDDADKYRDGAWYAWPFYLPFERSSSKQPFILFVEVALPVNFEEAGDVVTRWSTMLGNPQDASDLRYVLKARVDGTLKRQLDGSRIFNYLRALDKAT